MHTNPGKNLPKLDEQVGKNDKETKHQIEAKTAPLRTFCTDLVVSTSTFRNMPVKWGSNLPRIRKIRSKQVVIF